MPRRYAQGRFQLGSVGAAMGDGFLEILAQRQAEDRQQKLDAIAAEERAAKNEDRLMGRELQRAQLDSLNEQREAQRAKLAQDRAAGVAALLAPGANVDTDTASMFREGGLGVLLNHQPGTPSVNVQDGLSESFMQGESEDPAVSWSADRTSFRGTAKQLEEQQKQERLKALLDDPNTSPAIRAQAEWMMQFGGNAPASVLNPPDNSPKVGTFEDYVTQKYGTRPTPEQIAQGRREYGEAGRAPSISVNVPAMTDPAIDQAARYLLQTGRMPQGISARDVETQRRVRNRAAEMDSSISLSDSDLNRRADERFVAAANSPAANQLHAAIGNAEAHLTQMEKKFNDWAPGQIRTWNKAKFNLALEGALGATAEERQKNQIAASQVDQVYTDLVAALARVYTGGQAVTNDMLALASRNIDRDWSHGSIQQAIATQRKTLADRRAEFAKLNPRGVDNTLTRENAPAAPAGDTSSIQVTAPNGRTYTFATQAEADAFKQRAGIQ